MVEEKELTEEEQRNLWIKFNKRRTKENIFKILKMMDGAENRNSNFLAWLLNPNETHGLKTNFIKKFLNSLNSSLINTKNLDLDKVEIIREKSSENGRPDIIIENEKFLCLIEVKFGARQTNNQYEMYCNEYNESNCHKKVFRINLDIQEKKYDDFIPATWETNVLKVLKDIKPKNKLVKDYISFLEEKFYIYNGKNLKPNETINKKIIEKRNQIYKDLKENIQDIYTQDYCNKPFGLEIHPNNNKMKNIYGLLEFHEDKMLLKILIDKMNFNNDDIENFEKLWNGTYFKYSNKNLIKEYIIEKGEKYIDILYSDNIDQCTDKCAKKILKCFSHKL